MKKLIALTTIAIVGSTLLAAPRNLLKETPEERAARKAKAAAEFYNETGGVVLDMREAKGRIVVVNAQQSADEKWMKDWTTYFIQTMHVRIEVEKGTFTFPDVKMVGETTVFVIDDPKFPSLLAAPDQGWAAVNVAPLREGEGQKPQFFEARVKKEMTRALAAAAGGIDSNYPRNPVGPIKGVAGLDEYRDHRLAVDVLKRFEKTLAARGVTKYKKSTYEQACVEGWAASPTNDVQKKIWDRVHELPTKPIAIKPESQRK